MQWMPRQKSPRPRLEIASVCQSFVFPQPQHIEVEVMHFHFKRIKINAASRHAVLWCEMYNGAKEVVLSLASLYLAHNFGSLLYVFLLSK